MKLKFFYITFFTAVISIILFGDAIVALLDNGRGCKNLEKIYIDTYDINGIVELKFNDSESHRARTLKILNKGFLQDFTFQSEMQGFYEFVTEGDSIFKKAGNDTINVFRAGDVSIFRIDFNCKPYKIPPVIDVLEAKFKMLF